MTIWSKNGGCTWFGARIAFAFIPLVKMEYSVLRSVSPYSLNGKQYCKINYWDEEYSLLTICPSTMTGLCTAYLCSTGSMVIGRFVGPSTNISGFRSGKKKWCQGKWEMKQPDSTGNSAFENLQFPFFLFHFFFFFSLFPPASPVTQ